MLFFRIFLQTYSSVRSAVDYFNNARYNSFDKTAIKEGKRLVANVIRKHWRVENNLYRQLDINFEKDKSVVNTGSQYLGIFGNGLLESRRNVTWNEEYLTDQ